jgi:translation initiation factor 2 beta subunit (eIF-2beta)/eIF-5
MESMSFEEFTKKCLTTDKNVVKDWNYEAFGITCKKCGSDKCYAINDLTFREGTGGGCETCGYGADTGEVEGFITIKCGECGNAMSVITGKEITGKHY